MNIAVRGHRGNIFVRPDTTWERDSEDLYLPDFVDGLLWSLVLCARVSKPGRSIAGKFAGRYWDTAGFGILLFPENIMNDGSPEAFATANCLDHTSFIPMPWIPAQSLEGGKGVPGQMGQQPQDTTALTGQEKTGPTAEGKTLAEQKWLLYGQGLKVLAGQEGAAPVQCEFSGTDIKNMLDRAVCETSRLAYLRIGDIVAAEIEGASRMSIIHSKSDDRTNMFLSVTKMFATLNGQKFLDFGIHY